MKLTKLTIAPKSSWQPVSDTNPLRATVKIESENTAVETVLSDDDMRKMLDLVTGLIGDAAVRNANDFRNSVTAISDAAKNATLIEDH